MSARGFPTLGERRRPWISSLKGMRTAGHRNLEKPTFADRRIVLLSGSLLGTWPQVANESRRATLLDLASSYWRSTHSRQHLLPAPLTEADPRLQAEGFGGCRIEFDYAAGLRRGGGLQAAVGRARLDRLTSAWRPNPRHRLNVAHLPSLGTSPVVPPLGTSGTFASPEGEGFNHPRWGH